MLKLKPYTVRESTIKTKVQSEIELLYKGDKALVDKHLNTIQRRYAFMLNKEKYEKL